MIHMINVISLHYYWVNEFMMNVFHLFPFPHIFHIFFSNLLFFICRGNCFGKCCKWNFPSLETSFRIFSRHRTEIINKFLLLLGKLLIFALTRKNMHNYRVWQIKMVKNKLIFFCGESSGKRWNRRNESSISIQKYFYFIIAFL